MPLQKFKKIEEQLIHFASAKEVNEIRERLESLAKTEEIMANIEAMKAYFESQIDNFVVKSDFCETFQKIDEVLYEQRKKMEESEEQAKIFKSEIEEIFRCLDKKRYSLASNYL